MALKQSKIGEERFFKFVLYKNGDIKKKTLKTQTIIVFFVSYRSDNDKSKDHFWML